MDLEVTAIPYGDPVLAFVRDNSSRSDLLPPLGERVDPESRWYGAKKDGVLAGVASVSSVEKLARVGEICVDRGCRRRGIGRAMLQRIVDDSRSEGMTRVVLTDVDLRLEESKGFAEAMGFRLERDGIRMEWDPRPLPPAELPDGYELRTYREGDEIAWSRCINRAYSTTPNNTDYTP